MSRYFGRTRHIVRKSIDDYTPFTPSGLVPALGLGAVFLFGLIPFSSAWIQGTAKASAQNALSAIDADWASIKTSGQWITMEGKAPDQAASIAAERAIREATNRTPFGFIARPVTRVYNRSVVASPVTAPQVEPPVVVSQHDWEYTLDRSVLDLKGDVPDQATRDVILEAATNRKAPPRFASIRDNLTVTGRTASADFDKTALRGINAISRCNAGTASFADDTFSLNCEAPTGAAREIKMIANAPLPFGKTGRIDVFDTEEAEACDQSLIALLSTTRIEFASSSSVLDPASDPLLDEVADAAKTCPGKLSIEGHTDNSGRSSLNERLSSQRAEAIRRALIDRGIASGRLTAFGFGSARPIADNTTDSGRARNRRIEIKVARGSD